MNLTAEKRQLLENRIIRRAVRAILNAGHAVAAHDGEGFTVPRTTDLATFMKGLHSVDEESILVYESIGSKRRIGTIVLVYGNMPYEVINDYSTSLEALIKPANDAADRMEAWFI